MVSIIEIPIAVESKKTRNIELPSILQIKMKKALIPIALLLLATIPTFSQTPKYQVEIIQKDGDTIKLDKAGKLKGMPITSDNVWIRVFSKAPARVVEYKVIAFETMYIGNFGHDQNMGTHKNRFIEGQVLEAMKTAKSGDKLEIGPIELRDPSGKMIEDVSFSLEVK